MACGIAIGLLAVLMGSRGGSQTKESPASPPGAIKNPPKIDFVPLGSAIPPTPLLPPPLPPSSGQPLFQPPPNVAAIAAASTEKMIVKVYAVPDLVTDVQRRSKPTSTPVGVDPEAAMIAQQMQVYVQAVQKAAAQAAQ